MALTDTLSKLCLYKIRQLKIMQRGGDVSAEVLNSSLTKEHVLAESIPPETTMDDFDRALYNTYCLLEKRLLNVMQTDVRNTRTMLAEMKAATLLNKNYLP